MKKITTIIMSLIIALVTVPLSTSAETAKLSFKDVGDKFWAKSAIDSAVKKGIVSGYPDGTFKPNAPVTRAEFIKMIDDALGMKQVTVKGGAWWRGYVDMAVAMNIHDVKDFSSGYDKDITRLEVMRLATRALAGADNSYVTAISGGPDQVVDFTGSYGKYLTAFSGLYWGDIPTTDYRELADKDVRFVAMAMGTGIVGGYSDLSAGFGKTATRAESVVMIERMLQLKAKKPQDTFALKELYAVATTGSNADLFGWYTQYKYDPAKYQFAGTRIDYKIWSGDVKRVYFIPEVEGPYSFFEPKWIIDHTLGKKEVDDWNKEDPSSPATQKGITVTVLDTTPKVGGLSQYEYTNNTYMTSKAVMGFIDTVPKFGVRSNKYIGGKQLPDRFGNVTTKKGEKIELYVGGGYGLETGKWLEDNCVQLRQNYSSKEEMVLAVKKGFTWDY